MGVVDKRDKETKPPLHMEKVMRKNRESLAPWDNSMEIPPLSGAQEEPMEQEIAVLS